MVVLSVLIDLLIGKGVRFACVSGSLVDYVTLREFLDWFCSAYIDDVLIYTDGTREDHMAKVKQVIERLDKAGLKLDIDKYEFVI